jgi:hypothetical protein
LHEVDKWPNQLNISHWPNLTALDAVLDALHECAGYVTRDIDPLGPLVQREAKTAPFFFGSVLRALQSEQVCQAGANTLAVAFGARRNDARGNTLRSDPPLRWPPRLNPADPDVAGRLHRTRER